VFSTGSLKWNRITDETDRITDRIADKTDRITDENDRVIHAMFVAEFRDKQICDRALVLVVSCVSCGKSSGSAIQD